MKQLKLVVWDYLESMLVHFSLKSTLELNETTWNYLFPNYSFQKKKKKTIVEEWSNYWQLIIIVWVLFKWQKIYKI